MLSVSESKIPIITFFKGVLNSGVILILAYPENFDKF